MMHPTALGVGLAFVIAVASALVLMPLAVAAGRHLGFEVRPRLHGRGGPRVSYLGGAALALATCVAVVAAGDLRRDGPLLAGGLALLGLGLLDDRLGPAGLGRGVRIVAEVCVAFAVWWTALRPHAAAGALEGVLTVAGLVAAVNAFNLLDNMDGVCGATATAIALGLAALGLLAGRPGLSVLAAAAAGASLGFLRYNFGRARLYLGNGGATFLGLILGVSAFRSGLAFGPGWGPVAALAILALPATDTAVVTLARWLAARPVGNGGTDHLSHRLVRLRLSTAAAAAVRQSREGRRARRNNKAAPPTRKVATLAGSGTPRGVASDATCPAVSALLNTADSSIVPVKNRLTVPRALPAPTSQGNAKLANVVSGLPPLMRTPPDWAEPVSPAMASLTLTPPESGTPTPSLFEAKRETLLACRAIQ